MASASSLFASSFSASLPKRNRKQRAAPPTIISTKRADVDIPDLRDLFLAAGYSPHHLDDVIRTEPADVTKLSTAVANSSVVVSAFCSRTKLLNGFREDEGIDWFGVENFLERALPLRMEPADRELVGFGRAVSDGGLTGSLHDVVVHPSLQRLGIGRKIVQRILRLLINRGIYDISALCPERDRLFFQACSFGDDSLGSTTMMYTRSTRSSPQGRMSLLVPNSLELQKSSISRGMV